MLRERPAPAVPAAARSAWAVLQAAAVEHRPPCVADPRAWYAEDPETMAEAVRRCQDCPLLTPCGAYADAANEHWGVWAGVPRAATLSPRRPRRARHPRSI